MKLMIVDDSNIIRNKIERSATYDEFGFIVTGGAKNGVEAVELFKQTLPDIVTMDLTMPEMDGIECIEEIVKIRSDVLILVVSALADKATAIEALKKGAHGFLCKPFSDNDLQSALSELVEKV